MDSTPDIRSALGLPIEQEHPRPCPGEQEIRDPGCGCLKTVRQMYEEYAARGGGAVGGLIEALDAVGESAAANYARSRTGPWN